ncbi:hypothetical protein, partial [Candidatus Parabeggiatoa sp. HSG14]|uniref:hypothetical protein n=1 Tax=Candidatus Parabeggiatoa sp. HSG14 TaxID=3055593 RepID=UPI0025A77722|nr:hypothetical protein [Thiotrichales bacterium HSG14]
VHSISIIEIDWNRDIDFFEYGTVSIEKMLKNEKMSLFFELLLHSFIEGFIWIWVWLYSILWLLKFLIPFPGKPDMFAGWLSLILAIMLFLNIIGFIWIGYSLIVGILFFVSATMPLYFLKFWPFSSAPILKAETVIPKKYSKE